MWPAKVKEEALAACGRCCCVCSRFCGTNIELHHIKPESDSGESTLDNCIPLCFSCHSEVGHYNDRHPKGTKFSPGELRRHRDSMFAAMASADRISLVLAKQPPALPAEIYEGQLLQFRGYAWRQTFPGPPNYEDFSTDAIETYWLMILSAPIRFNYESVEDQSPLVVPEARVLHLVMSAHQYAAHKDKLNRDVLVTGKVFSCLTGHHHGDVLIEVEHFELAP